MVVEVASGWRRRGAELVVSLAVGGALIGYIVLAAVGLLAQRLQLYGGETSNICWRSLGAVFEVNKDALSRDFICIGGTACGEQYNDIRLMLCLSLHGG